MKSIFDLLVTYLLGRIQFKKFLFPLPRLLSFLRRRPQPTLPQDLSQKLSSELLALIFESSKNYDCYDAQTVISFSLVCRRWREVAIATPSIWTCVDLGADWAKTFLTRSQGLHVCITDVVSSGLKFNFSQLLSHKQPEEIYSLTLSGTEGAKHNLQFEITRGLTKLQRLHFDSFSIHYWGWFGSLTDLHIEDLERSCCPKADTIVYVLKQNPQLRNIYLFGLDPEVPEGPSNQRCVHLNHLDDFTMFVSPPATRYLLSHLVIPPSAPLYNKSDPKSNQLRSRILRVHAESASFGEDGEPSFAIFSDMYTEPDFPIIRNLVASVDLSSVTSFNISDVYLCDVAIEPETVPSIEMWTLILTHLPSVTSIWLLARKAEFAKLFLQALYPNNETQLVPCLRDLRIDIFKFDAGESVSFGTLILEQLTTRHRVDKEPLEALSINFGDTETIDKLQALVKKVSVGALPPSYDENGVLILN